ncbi:molybdopterin molybdenumtransferase MoeA, partial [Dietzia sp. SLG510A3-40A3]|nr:molybdopterin molybdenumtransferase MoeA [Dietzia sp. SLG510A3-30A2]MBB0994167.1 molybdopterin molybdenumtransferase MoeA [Dietzia sp. SLG510A3-40A3]
VTSPARRVQYLRAALAADGDGLPTVDPVSGPGSHLVASMARADVLIEIPADVTSLESGAEIDVLPL